MIQKPKKKSSGPKNKFDAWLATACSSKEFWRAPGPCDHAMAERLVAVVIVQGSKDAANGAFPNFQEGDCPACALIDERANGRTFAVVHSSEIRGPALVGTMPVTRTS